MNKKRVAKLTGGRRDIFENKWELGGEKRLGNTALKNDNVSR